MAMKNSINLYAPYFSLLILLASLVAVALNPNLFEPTIIKIPCRLQEENTSCECSKTDSSAFAMITTTFNGNLDIYKTNASGTKAFEDLQNSYGGGFLQVAHNSTFAPGWGVSMLHGLHCLQMIRSSLFPEEYSENEHSPDSSHHQHAALNHDHITHCIGYLAQSIMCAGDDTIEPPLLAKDANGDILEAWVDGMNYQHQCKSTEFVQRVMEKASRGALTDWGWKSRDTLSSVFGNHA